jgi:hypothetical protein
MAGSYRHLIDAKGNFTFALIENMGDAYEACEDCFKIIKGLKSLVKILKTDNKKSNS